MFRQLRSMGTTQQTVINFSAKELTEKLKRIHTKNQIMHKYKNSINFPSLSILQKQPRDIPELPSDAIIIETIEKAQNAAREALIRIGMAEEEIDMTDSIIVRKSRSQEAGNDSVEDEDYYMEEDDEHEFEEEIDDCDTRNSEDEEMFDESESEECTGETFQEVQPIYDAEELFPNCNDTLNLKSSTTGEKHSFRIRDKKGNVKSVKKSTFLWMVTPAKYRLSSDRLRRFVQREFK